MENVNKDLSKVDVQDSALKRFLQYNEKMEGYTDRGAPRQI